MSTNGYLLPDVVDPGEYKCVVIKVPNEPNHQRAFWGHLFELARWWSWERDDDHTGTLVAQVWKQIWLDALDLFIKTDGACPMDGQTTTPAAGVGNYSSGGGCHDNDCEECMPLTMLHIGGRDILAEVCCGQETILYEVNRIAADLSPATGDLTVSTAADMATGEIVPWSVPTDYQTCFTGKAVPYLLERCANYIELMWNIATLGLDAISNADETGEGLAIAADLLDKDNKNWLDILQETPIDDIKAAIQSQATIDHMSETFNYSGPLNRWQLIKWAYSAPFTVNLVPVKALVTYWAQNSLIPNLNGPLRVYAAECENGQNLDDIAESIIYSEHEYNGSTYPIWDLSGLNVDVTQLTEYAPVSNAVNPQALYGEMRANGNGAITGGCYVKLNSKHAYLNVVNYQVDGVWEEGIGREGVRVDPVYDAVVSDYAGDTYTGEGQNNNAPGPLFDGFNMAGPFTYFKLTRVILVGAALT